MVEPAGSSHGRRMGLTHHKESTDLALKGIFHPSIHSFTHQICIVCQAWVLLGFLGKASLVR